MVRCTESSVPASSLALWRLFFMLATVFNVVPRREGEFDAWGGDEGTKTNMPAVKARQVRAVEQVSRCKVTDAEYMPGTWVLQTRIKC